MATPVEVARVELEYREGSSDKVYQIWIENVGANYTVKFRYGRRGGTLAAGTKTVDPTHSAAARNIFDEVVKEKVGKGYIATRVEGSTLYLDATWGSSRSSRPKAKEKSSLDKLMEASRLLDAEKAAAKLGMASATATRAPTESEKLMAKVRDERARIAQESRLKLNVPILLNSISESQVQEMIKRGESVFQEKHDGKRMMLKNAGNSILAYNRKGEEIEPPSEYVEAIGQGLGLYDFVIDGEACGPVFYAFDILTLEGVDCRTMTYEERLTNLGMLLRSGGPQKTIRMVVTAFTPAEKLSLFNECKRLGKEGVAIKDRNALYTGGRPNSGGPYLKFKFIESVTCTVIKVNDKRSVELGMLQAEDESIVSVGNVTIPANHDIPKKGDFVEVEYLYAYKGGSLYQPVYKGKRDDKYVADDIEQLKYKSAGDHVDIGSAFSAAVKKTGFK